MTINQVIKELERARDIVGNVPVIFSTDSEGNAFFNLDQARRADYTDAIIFYPLAVSEDLTPFITNGGDISEE